MSIAPLLFILRFRPPQILFMAELTYAAGCKLPVGDFLQLVDVCDAPHLGLSLKNLFVQLKVVVVEIWHHWII